MAASENGIDAPYLKRVYSQLKQIGDRGLLYDEARSHDLDRLPILEIAVTHDDVGIARMFRTDSDSKITVRDLAAARNRERKVILEQILDFVFSSEPGKNLYLNFGALLREYALTQNDVQGMKEYLIDTPCPTVRSMLRDLLYVASEIETLLAVLFAGVGDETIQEQFANAASYIELPEITDEFIDALTNEFDQQLEAVESERRQIMEPIALSLDKSIERKVDEAINLCDMIENNMRTMKRDMTIYTKKVVDIEMVKVSHLSTAFAKLAAAHASDVVLPRLPPNAQLSATCPKTSCASTGWPADITVTEVRKEIEQELLLARHPPEELPPPAVGDTCLAKRGQVWALAKFRGFNMIGWPEVQFLDSPEQVLVAREHIAYSSPPSWYMHLGERMVAEFDLKTKEGVVSHWMSGIVAEQPSISRNRGRYLVFNDLGDARYVEIADIRCCCAARSSKGPPSFWNDILNKLVRDFLKRLVDKLPEKKLVRLKPNETVRIYDEETQTFRKTRVMEIDCLMAKLQFSDGATNWVYRGDWRLQPIFEQQEQERSITRRHHSRHAGPVVEFVGGESDEDDEITLIDDYADGESFAKKLPTARKSTNAKANIRLRHGVQVPANNNQTPGYPQLRKQEFLEHYRRVIDQKPIAFSEKDFCDETCLGSNDDPQTHKNENPLLIPLICGWHRSIEETRTRSRVAYLPPCEHKKMQNEKQLQDYLTRTDCRLTIDLFDFDVEFDPFESIRVIQPFVYLDDFTNGRENVRIECVNSFTEEKPLFPQYENQRYTTDTAVDLMGSKLFISGCDCTDNCADPKRCQCQLLTTTQANSMAHGRTHKNRVVGYRYRRLPEGPVSTGIYECNQNCKCNCRCPNRVVQQPLLTRLQLFRTVNKGWGVRSLDGIPKGAFVCVYAGNVLSDQAANEVGQKQGDEYFADLDMILCAENEKEGYEEEVVEPYESSDDDDEKRKKRKKIGNNFWDDDENSRGAYASSRRSSGDSDTNRPWLMSKYLGDDNSVYILDAKFCGNVGRYLNHSCSPNVYVQNVFVDTHDMRLPWVAFFAWENIRAGTELCWDYRYTPMDDRPMACNCGALNCRKRLM